MKKYYIHRFYKTPISLSQDREAQQKDILPSWSFNFPSDKVSVCVRDEVRVIDGKNFHFGLMVVAEVFANSDEEAMNISMMYSEALMNMFVFSTLSVCSAPKLISIIEFSESEESNFKNSVYAFNASEAVLKILPIEIKKFNQIYNGCNRLINSERTMRAMSWLRKGINEKNSIDKFISFWVGLEVLKGVFPAENTKEMISIWKKSKMFLCKKICGKRRNSNKDEWRTIENIFIEKLKRDDFRKIKRARSAILHGFGELSPEFHKQVDEYWDIVKKVLIWSLGIIVELDNAQIESIISNEQKSYLNIRYVVGGKIDGLSGKFKDDFKNFPSIDLAEDDVKSSVNEKGEISLKFKTTFKTKGANKIKWKLRFSEVWGE